MFNIFRIVENRRYYFLLSAVVIALGLAAMIYNTLSEASRSNR